MATIEHPPQVSGNEIVKVYSVALKREIVMSTVTKKRRTTKVSAIVFGREHNGIVMTPQEFDAGDFDELFDYELINGVLVVVPPAHEEDLTISEELNYHLRTYRDLHPEGWRMITTLSGQYLLPSNHRLRIDRVVWTGPRPDATRKEIRPTITIDIPSLRIQRRPQDCQMRCDECMRSGADEYWIVDRLAKTLKVKTRRSLRWRVIRENQGYETPVLPGFVPPLKRIFERAAEWACDDDQKEETT